MFSMTYMEPNIRASAISLLVKYREDKSALDAWNRPVMYTSVESLLTTVEVLKGKIKLESVYHWEVLVALLVRAGDKVAFVWEMAVAPIFGPVLLYASKIHILLLTISPKPNFNSNPLQCLISWLGIFCPAAIQLEALSLAAPYTPSWWMLWHCNITIFSGSLMPRWCHQACGAGIMHQDAGHKFSVHLATCIVWCRHLHIPASSTAQRASAESRMPPWHTGYISPPPKTSAPQLRGPSSRKLDCIP